MTIDVKKLMWDIGCGELTPGVEHYAVTPAQLENLIAASWLQGERVNQGLLALLRRYRTETPLGHQPHMIAEQADAAIAAAEKEQT